MQLFGARANVYLTRCLTVVFIAMLSTVGQSREVDKLQFDLTEPLRAYYQSIIELDWHRADSLSASIKSDDADNALVYLFDNYSIVTQILITDRESMFRQYRDVKETHLRRLKKSDKSSPYYRYVRAEILLQWAILNYKYEHRLTALKDVWTAYGLLEDNLELHPDFKLTYRSMGMLHAFMGTMPVSDKMKWLLEKTSGMSGTIAQGMSELKKAVDYGASQPNFLFYEECKGLYAYLLLHLANDAEAAWLAVNEINILPEQSALAGFVYASLALKTGHLDECLAYVDRIAEEDYARLPFNYFIKGKAELYQSNKNCGDTFDKFLALHQGDSYRFAAYQKTAWNHLINGDETNYRNILNQCLSDAILLVGEDKDALQEARQKTAVNKYLLQARILFDGYQFEPALKILNKQDYLGQHTETSLEYYYRRGRIYQGLKLFEAAKNDLERAYLLGEQNHTYHACNAALQIGLIHQASEDQKAAKVWFNRCLDLNPDAYRKSLHHKAKSGLKRLPKEK